MVLPTSFASKEYLKKYFEEHNYIPYEEFLFDLKKDLCSDSALNFELSDLDSVDNIRLEGFTTARIYRVKRLRVI